MKVLVIDDSKFHCLALRRSLGDAGHEVITAGNGEEGLRAARESTPDLIVLDMMLPRMSGVDVLRTLRQEKKTEQVPIIVLSGLSEKNRGRLMEEGATGYLEKSEALLQGYGAGSLLSAVAHAGLSSGKSTGDG